MAGTRHRTPLELAQAEVESAALALRRARERLHAARRQAGPGVRQPRALSRPEARPPRNLDPQGGAAMTSAIRRNSAPHVLSLFPRRAALLPGGRRVGPAGANLLPRLAGNWPAVRATRIAGLFLACRRARCMGGGPRGRGRCRDRTAPGHRHAISRRGAMA